MKKTLISITLATSIIALGACEPNKPCMDPEEKGTVIRSKSEVREFCGRGGCSLYSTSFIVVNVNGVSRTCVINDSTSSMFTPGEVINLMTGRRM
jgi:hypothetical protein